MNEKIGPLLTLHVHEALRAAQVAGREEIQCSLDLGRSKGPVIVGSAGWVCKGRVYPFLDVCKERPIYYWNGTGFEAVARFNGGLIKLVATDWGPPTFEIDGIKMLPTAHVSPYADAERKVGLIAPQGKTVLDTCGGLGYFAACCLQAGAQRVQSFEKNADVIWLRSLNPWSPVANNGNGLSLTHGDVVEHLAKLPSQSVDAILHDPPRFGIAGELYSQAFYHQLARVIRPRGKLFHYTGTPNKLTSKRDVPNEVAKRLQLAGFTTTLNGDGVVAVRNTSH